MMMKVKELDSSHIAHYDRQALLLKEAWKKHLQVWNVKWPSSNVKIAQLVGLSFFLGEPVQKDSLGNFVNKIAGGALDTQARHLRGDGWYLIGGGRGEGHNNTLPTGVRMPRSTYCLVSLTIPHPVFVQSDRLKRQGRVAARDWNELCAFYEGKCAHCGTVTKYPDKGHMNPNKKADLGNLIPLCVSCNNWAADDVIFDENGRIEAILSERFLNSADQPARRRILAWLQKNTCR